MSLVGTQRTLDGLGPVIAAEFARDINRLLRKHLEDLFVVGGPDITAVGRSVVTTSPFFLFRVGRYND